MNEKCGCENCVCEVDSADIKGADGKTYCSDACACGHTDEKEAGCGGECSCGC